MLRAAARRAKVQCRREGAFIECGSPLQRCHNDIRFRSRFIDKLVTHQWHAHHHSVWKAFKCNGPRGSGILVLDVFCGQIIWMCNNKHKLFAMGKKENTHTSAYAQMVLCQKWCPLWHESSTKGFKLQTSVSINASAEGHWKLIWASKF